LPPCSVFPHEFPGGVGNGLPGFKDLREILGNFLFIFFVYKLDVVFTGQFVVRAVEQFAESGIEKNKIAFQVNFKIAVFNGV